VAANFDRQLIEEHPELRGIFEAVSKELTTETMLQLNAEVDVEGRDPALVARDWLVEKGFVS
jgi:osmoprotectant transport system substrate-binding protein